MNQSAVRMTVCGIDELDRHNDSGITHVLSILDPGSAEPNIFSSFRTHIRKTLHFHDELEPGLNISLPQRAHIEAIIAFGRSLGPDHINGTTSHILVHCHMGISRSTAATGILFASLYPSKSESKIFAHILELRPQAWPNCRMIELADDLLQREGRLTAALGRLYAVQLARDPAIGSRLRTHGRGREVDMGLFAQNNGRKSSI